MGKKSKLQRDFKEKKKKKEGLEVKRREVKRRYIAKKKSGEWLTHFE